MKDEKSNSKNEKMLKEINYTMDALKQLKTSIVAGESKEEVRAKYNKASAGLTDTYIEMNKIFGK